MYFMLYDVICFSGAFSTSFYFIIYFAFLFIASSYKISYTGLSLTNSFDCGYIYG
jgi:hypothetical protein